MKADDEELAEKRAAVDKAMKEFITCQSSQQGVADAYVLGWAAFAEYTSIDLESEDATGNVVIVPDGQAGSMSRGLFAFGADAFGRGLR